jgi:hypothetical protein
MTRARAYTPNPYLKFASRKTKLSNARGAARKAPSNTKKSKVTYNICGEKFVATDVFDTFWHFAAERKLIYDKRTNGIAAP